MQKCLLIVFGIAIVMMGCNPDKLGILGTNDVMILYTSIDDNSEIITVEVKEKALHLEIKHEKRTELTKRIIPFRQGDLRIFEYKELSRMPSVAVFHFVPKSLDEIPVERKNEKYPVPNNSAKFGKHPNAVTFRHSDRLYIYWKIPTNWLPIPDDVAVTEFRIEDNVLHAKIKRDPLGVSGKRIILTLKDLNIDEKIIIPENVSHSRVGDILRFNFPIIISGE